MIIVGMHFLTRVVTQRLNGILNARTRDSLRRGLVAGQVIGTTRIGARLIQASQDEHDATTSN